MISLALESQSPVPLPHRQTHQDVYCACPAGHTTPALITYEKSALHNDDITPGVTKNISLTSFLDMGYFILHLIKIVSPVHRKIK